MALADIEKKLSWFGFYNPKLGALQCSISITKMALSLKFGSPIDSNNTSRPKPGEIRFNYSDDFIISMVEMECCMLSSALKSLLAGSFVNPNPKSDKDTGKLIFMRPNKILSFEKVDNHGDASIKVSLYNMDVKQSRYFIFSVKKGELTAFCGLVNSCATLMPFACLAIRGMIKAMKAAEYDENNGDSTGGSSRPQQSSSTYNKPTSQPRQSVLPIDSAVGSSGSPWDDEDDAPPSKPAPKKAPAVSDDDPWDEPSAAPSKAPAPSSNTVPWDDDEDDDAPPLVDDGSESGFW